MSTRRMKKIVGNEIKDFFSRFLSVQKKRTEHPHAHLKLIFIQKFVNRDEWQWEHYCDDTNSGGADEANGV